ncbi:MAG: polyprenyl synthetase family protein [Bacteroidales bacterium]|jgi:geranylgeranyl diphosphate synthase type II|nr:polyprenyl synthetase family protein [Bacteroidales bacterium]MCI2122101.1 polyprenyl synthetase family protein [Bacteroidales bacterium]MCI2146332.1 polyprenyl synthetase family protein [Bacteroidales bacterium]
MYSLSEIDGIVQKSLANTDLKGEPAELYDPMEYMVAIGGKRIRPRLCLTVYNLFSDNIPQEVIYPALALEIFHEFTLVHDDIMDKAELRRNQPTVCRKWGGNVAILSGDVMFIKAYQLLSECDPAKLPSLLSLFSETAAKVCEGQQYDMNYGDLPFITMEDYINMIGLKTGVLIACAAKMGVLLAGPAFSGLADSLYRFGYLLGITFQITDDYLDCFGDVSSFGKKIGGDIAENKKSWLLVESMRISDASLRKRLTESMAISDEKEKIAAMQRFYVDSGVKTGAERAIEKYYGKAIEVLEGTPLDSGQRARMTEFAKAITYRIR